MPSTRSSSMKTRSGKIYNSLGSMELTKKQGQVPKIKATQPPNPAQPSAPLPPQPSAPPPPQPSSPQPADSSTPFQSHPRSSTSKKSEFGGKEQDECEKRLRINQYFQEGECINMNQGRYEMSRNTDGSIVSVPVEPELVFGETATKIRNTNNLERESLLMEMLDSKQRQAKGLELQLALANDTIAIQKTRLATTNQQ